MLYFRYAKVSKDVVSKYCIEGGRYAWKERTVNVRDITLTGMGETLTLIIYSDEVMQNPLKFVEYVQRHKPMIGDAN